MSGCASQQASSDDPDALFRAADEDLKEERFISALEKFRDIKNRFPYSNRALDAELKIADTYFAQESYIEAESAYEIFKELHPTHSQGDYVQFQIAMSSYRQSPDNVARDLTSTHKAIEAFEVLVERFPSSAYSKRARELIDESRRKLAAHENYVADFYYNREHYLSASFRYAALLKDFPNLGYDEEALFRLGKCYFNTKMYANAKDTFKRLHNAFPATSFKAESDSLLEEISKKLK